MTQKSTTGLVPVYMRAIYSYTAMNRVVGRRVEAAPQSAGSNAPNASWRLATAQEMVSDSLPASTTFVWDPISDQLVAIFEAERYEGTGVVASGRLLRQFIHGGMGLDDPIEVTIGDGSTVRRVYPIYDEAATGALQAIVDDHGKLLQRTFMADAYGAEEATLTGPSADRVRLTTKKDNDGKVTEVQIDLRITEPVDAGTLEAGARLSTVTASGTTAYVSPVVPTLPDPNTVRWTLNATQWTSLSAATNASALSIAATADLRSTTFGANVPLSPPAIAASGIVTNGPNPFEYREPLTTFTSATNGIITTTTPYELATPGEAATPGHPTDSASSLIISSFQAQPFYDTFIGKNYVRNRWYDPASGTWLTPDPLGYEDSANMYSFAGGDPVNGRDPEGLAVSRGRSGIFVISDVRDGRRGRTYRITTQWVMQHKAMFAAILDSVAGVKGIAALQYMDVEKVGIRPNTDQTVGGLAVAMAQVDEALNEATKAYLMAYVAVSTGGLATSGLSAAGATGFTATTVGNFTAGVAAQGTSDLIDQRFSGVGSYLSAGASTAAVGWVFEGGSWVLKELSSSEVGAAGAGTPSAILRENLKKGGVRPPPFPNAAHHIVAFDSVLAQEARGHLKALGIGMNDAENGVFLRYTERGVGANHRLIHTQAYYTEVNTRILATTSAEQARLVLQQIAQELKAGTFPY